MISSYELKKSEGRKKNPSQIEFFQNIIYEFTNLLSVTMKLQMGITHVKA